MSVTKPARSRLTKVSVGKFGWGGTSVKRQRRCPKINSNLTETNWGLKGEKLVLLQGSVRFGETKVGPIDPVTKKGASAPDSLKSSSDR